MYKIPIPGVGVYCEEARLAYKTHKREVQYDESGATLVASCCLGEPGYLDLFT